MFVFTLCFDGGGGRLLGAGGKRPRHLHHQPTGCELRQGNSYEGNWDGGEQQHSELHSGVMFLKTQRKEVT